MTELIGWLSSFILLITLITQIRKQWRERTSQGVSKWLFGGQVAAEIGFVIYSVLLENRVFAVTNGVLVLVNFVGLYLTLKFRRQSPTT